jgi:hypothetical protein
VCHIFFTFKFLSKKMTKKSKKKEQQAGDQPRTSKRKQQSAPVASGVSVPEKAKKPKGVAAEAAVSSVLSPSAEVGKEPSASNVAEEEQKMPALPKCAAVARDVIGAGPVAAEVGDEAVEGQGVAGEKLEEAEENKDDDDDEDDSGGDDDEEEEKSDDEGSEYAPLEDGSEGTVILADDAVAHIDNLPDVVKPSQKEKVSSPFDLPILPIAKTMLVKKGKKGNTIPDGDDDSILMLTDDEAKSATPSKQKKKVLATKSPPPGSASKVGTSASSEEALMMVKGCQELFFNLPWQNYVSVFVPFIFQFS